MTKEINKLDDFTEKELLKILFTNLVNLKMQVNKLMEHNGLNIGNSIIDDEIIAMVKRSQDMEKQIEVIFGANHL